MKGYKLVVWDGGQERWTGPYYRENVQVIDQETGEDVWDEL